jgi:glutaminyl-peptide cyclotransferase
MPAPRSVVRHPTLLVLAVLAACEQAADRPAIELVRVLPHDTGAYTQGLLVDDGRLFESTGRYGHSTLREVDPATGAVLRSVRLDERYFGEGLALVGDRLIQLTWQDGKAFIYDRDSFELLGSFDYEGEGWGLCFDGESLFMTDGTSTLQRRDPADFRLLDSRRITLGGAPLARVNELECVGDDIYGNVYLTDLIVRIDRTTGAVQAVFDAAGLIGSDRPANADAVLNGIAWNQASGTFFITGKLWPRMYEVRLVEPPPES